jgi:hypothetical protein
LRDLFFVGMGGQVAIIRHSRKARVSSSERYPTENNSRKQDLGELQTIPSRLFKNSPDIFPDGLEGKHKSLDGGVSNNHGIRFGENVPKGVQGLGGILMFEV